jgi:hypothetical protein
LATREALLALFMRARAGGEDFSRAERVLCTACEFWAAANNRTLSQHLGNEADAKLRMAEESFAAIGLASIATILHVARVNFTSADHPVRLHKVAAGIEKSLARADEPVDELIEHFACEQTWERLRR